MYLKEYSLRKIAIVKMKILSHIITCFPWLPIKWSFPFWRCYQMGNIWYAKLIWTQKMTRGICLYPTVNKIISFLESHSFFYFFFLKQVAWKNTHSSIIQFSEVSKIKWWIIILWDMLSLEFCWNKTLQTFPLILW